MLQRRLQFLLGLSVGGLISIGASLWLLDPAMAGKGISADEPIAFVFSGTTWEIASTDPVAIGLAVLEPPALPANPDEATRSSIFSGYAWGTTIDNLVGIEVEQWMSHGKTRVRPLVPSKEIPVSAVLSGSTNGFSWYGYAGSGVEVRESPATDIVHRANVEHSLRHAMMTLEPEAALRRLIVRNSRGVVSPLPTTDTMRHRGWRYRFENDRAEAVLVVEGDAQSVSSAWTLVIRDFDNGFTLVTACRASLLREPMPALPSNPSEIANCYSARLRVPVVVNDKRASAGPGIARP